MRKRSLEGCQAEEPAGKKARDYVEERIAGTCDTDKVSDNAEEPQAVEKLVQEKGKLLAPCSTRWLSTERSVNRLKSCFISVALSLERQGKERSDAKAVGLSRFITEYRFVCTILLLCDTLPHVTH